MLYAPIFLVQLFLKPKFKIDAVIMIICSIVAIDTRTNNVNTSKDKSRLILLHIITGGLITVQ